MTHTVHCQKLNQTLEGLAKPPYPGPIGERIYNNISKEAWQLWQRHQTMLINEYRLSLIEPKSREFLEKEMLAFLFGNGSEKPKGYTPEN
jgi:Fe-S cluster biosynthesis and repair protein YggX